MLVASSNGWDEDIRKRVPDHPAVQRSRPMHGPIHGLIADTPSDGWT